MDKLRFNGMLTFMWSSIIFLVASFHSTAQPMSSDKFTVTQVPAENGSYSIDPPIPADGKVPPGTVLTVKAKASRGYSLDVIYYTVKGGMWGTTSYEYFSSPMKITVDKDMSVGATFVEKSLVDNLDVTHDVVYAKQHACNPERGLTREVAAVGHHDRSRLLYRLADF